MKHLITTILVLLFAVLACGLPPATPTATATATSIPSPTPTATATATSIPNPTPTMPASLLPSGFVVRTNSASIQFYSLNGSVTGSLTTSTLMYFGPQSLHVAGGTSAGIPPVVYIEGNFSGVSHIFQNTGGLETVLVSISGFDFFSMAGAEVSPYFAYTTATIVSADLLNRLYVGTPATIGTATPVVDITGGSQALKPLALDMAGGIPIGVWYTGYQFGVGVGAFEPCERLVYLDLNTGVSSELLGNGFYFPQLSPDHTWVAYTGGEMLTILNLVTGANYTFPVVSGQPGDGVFSPDNTYVAWMEASGEIMGDTPNFQTMVRVGTTNGLLFADYPAQDFNTTANFTVIRARPVAWLDNDSVLIQVGNDTNNAVLRLDLPSTLVYIASGSLVSLTYP
jgi:hypothetical protein